MKKCIVSGLPTVNKFKGDHIHPLIMKGAKNRREIEGESLNESLVYFYNEIKRRCQKVKKGWFGLGLFGARMTAKKYQGIVVSVVGKYE